jgi:U-box domain
MRTHWHLQPCVTACARTSRVDCKLQDGQRSRDERDLEEVFAIAAKADHEDEADGAYTCTLTMEPFRDPVITPDGNSYEKAALLEHLAKACACSASPLLVPCSKHVTDLCMYDRDHRRLVGRWISSCRSAVIVLLPPVHMRRLGSLIQVLGARSR